MRRTKPGKRYTWGQAGSVVVSVVVWVVWVEEWARSDMSLHVWSMYLPLLHSRTIVPMPDSSLRRFQLVHTIHSHPPTYTGHTW